MVTTHQNPTFLFIFVQMSLDSMIQFTLYELGSQNQKTVQRIHYLRYGNELFCTKIQILLKKLKFTMQIVCDF